MYFKDLSKQDVQVTAHNVTFRKYLGIQ